SAEKMAYVRAAYPNAIITQTPAEIALQDISAEDAIFAIVQGWMSFAGPVTAEELSQLLQLPASEIQTALIRLESTGAVLRGKFRRHSDLEWCERKILARIHRATLGTLRKQIQPVTAAQFMHWLLKWQHVTKGTQMRGEAGLLEVLHQLQGFEIPAREWE